MYTDQQPHIRGWLLASVDGVNTGYIPSNHVKVLGVKKGRKQQQHHNTQNTTTATQNVSTLPQQTVASTAASNEVYLLGIMYKNANT